MNKVAVLIDSGCDIPQHIKADLGIYTLPLKIVYKDREYRDNIDISPKQVYDGLKTEIPTTSLPSPEETQNIFEEIKNNGFNDVICITISTGLSGTHNMIKVVADDIKDMNIKMVDSKNIAMGSGFLGILAGKLAREEKNIDEIYNEVMENVKNTTAIFCVDTLTYLRKGGRIGLVAGILGEKFNLKPIIACNDDGIYDTLAKARGKKKAVEKMIDAGKKFIGNAEKYNVCICNGGAYDEIDAFARNISENFSGAEKIYQGDISPALGVHTGPGLLGLGIQIIK